MTKDKSYFFCGIGGSGMLPLASILRGRGATVAGSDRALDQGRTADKFDWLRAQGIALFPQDGSGLTQENQILVASAAVEDSVPDVMASRELGLERMTRPELLASLFNAAPRSIGVAGTSGKSTVTGMIGWILHDCGRDPTVMNGAVMRNFISDETPFASALVGQGDAFVSEVDESDGSIALYEPDIAILNNVSLDHKSMDELRTLFGGFLARAGHAIVNADDAESARLADAIAPDRLCRFGFDSPDADLRGENIVEAPLSVAFDVIAGDEKGHVELAVPGRHNAANALAALAAARACDVPLADAVASLGRFSGLRRRFEIVGTAGRTTVIDDFGHNPDKIAATLKTLHAFPGRLLVFFQPHGYGPLKKMGDELIACFADNLSEEDRLILCDPVYFGGTTDRSTGSGAIVDGVAAAGRTAEHIPDRADCGARLAALAGPGDRIIVMGARDDTLSAFAADILERIGH
ncbi:UDP-N-acetylmuramate--alanine ligase [Parasphingopyxis algicola]|uniref:Mur ligase family protein n=1 Tax=Parasphingopyxis algicola TaxID=2026624 RepID=UPI0015A2CE95|nr:Mur ligase family protein [Parasphingopyxis algicola]QLC23768.1 UDP-N-acetylmuramate--alanine ligase [Parasphingopyxis algicola]